MDSDVVATGLWKAFDTEEGGSVVALKNVDLAVRHGQFYVLVGDSGSGKTTLMRCVAGLERPDAGRIVLHERLVSAPAQSVFVPPQERGIGMVFQSYAIWPHLSVYENVSTPLTYGRNKRPAADVHKRVMEALDIVGLSALANRPAPNLSGGQQQRVALARAIAVSTELLLMDEPMSNLDARLRQEVRAQIRNVANHYGTTVIYVTHDQEEAISLADEIGLMRNGEILQRGIPEELYDRSLTREIAEFFGPMNIVEGRVLGDGEIGTPLGRVKAPTAVAAGTNVFIGLRPERIRINPAGSSAENTFDALIADRVYLGSVKIYYVNCGDFTFRVDSTFNYHLGDNVKIEFPRDALRLFPMSERQATGPATGVFGERTDIAEQVGRPARGES